MFLIKKKIKEILNIIFSYLGFELKQIPTHSKILIFRIPSFDWSFSNNDFNKIAKREKVSEFLTINWLVPYFEKSSGGHTTIFRFIKYLASKGHKNRIIVVNENEARNDQSMKSYIDQNYMELGDVETYIGGLNLPGSDVNIATSWDTAYFSYMSNNTKLKSYFIQDFEQWFYPMSVSYLMAQNTYKMGYYNIAASKWLYQKTVEEINAEGTWFDLGVDFNTYFEDNKITRDQNQILVYWRSWSARRATELIIPSLEKVFKENPEVKIKIFGDDNLKLEANFEYENLGIIKPSEIMQELNKSAITLVFSLTNYSLLPQEAMACGSMVIDLDLENNRVSQSGNNGIVLAQPNPQDISSKILHYQNNPDERLKITNNAKNFVKNLNWENSFKKIEKALLEQFS